MNKGTFYSGFTLIELSIVLVIIGLIVGGVLVGQSLVSAAAVRSQITQIEKFNTAVNTFRGKYNALPGDMSITVANQFGFTVGTGCNGIQGQRDGNGLIDAWNSVGAGYLEWQAAGETALFWQDLSSNIAGNLIDGSFQGNAGAIGCNSPGNVSATALPQFLPAAKIGNGNWVYVYENGGYNWFGIEAMTGMDSNGTPTPYPTMLTTISVNQAYSIDKKIDDGLPQSGNVKASYATAYSPGNGVASSPNAAGDSATTCFNTTAPAYSVAYNNGTGANCALSFRFQ